MSYHAHAHARDMCTYAYMSSGGLAVIYDKNIMETSGYAAAMSDVMKEVSTRVHIMAQMIRMCHKDVCGC